MRACVRAASGPFFSLFPFFALALWPRRLRASLAPSACAILVAAFVCGSGHRDFSVAIRFQSSKKHVSFFSRCGFLFCRGGRQRNARNRCEFVRFRAIERERQRQTHIHQMSRCFLFVSCVCEEAPESRNKEFSVSEIERERRRPRASGGERERGAICCCCSAAGEFVL
jgi:hypothetical protein